MYNFCKNAKKMEYQNSTELGASMALRPRTKAILTTGSKMAKYSAKPGGEGENVLNI
jgi:hypothetical protein